MPIGSLVELAQVDPPRPGGVHDPAAGPALDLDTERVEEVLVYQA